MMQKIDIYKSFVKCWNHLILLSFILVALTLSNCGKKAEPLRPIETEKIK